MTQRPQRDNKKGAWIAVVVSVVVHLIIVAVFLPPKLAEWKNRAKEEENKEFEVTTTFEEAEPDPESDPEPDKLVETEPLEPIEPKEEEKPEPKEEQTEKKELEDVDLNRKVVQQQTNEEMPEKADYLSQQANKVEEETRARETTTKDVLPGKTVPEEIEELTGSEEKSNEAEELASRTEPVEEPTKPAPTEQEPTPPQAQEASEPTLAEEAEAEEGALEARKEASDSPVVKRKSGKVNPQKLFQPSAKDYDKVFGETDKKLKSQMKEETRGRKLLAGWKEREKAVRASLENHITEVKPGNHTGVNAKPAIYANYIGRIHRKIHAHWGASYLPRLDTQYPAGHPLNDSSLNSKLEFVIDAKSGKVDSVNIVESSGELMFDAEAVSISYMIGPHRSPPGEIVSPDGKVYIHWNFWRDQRQCGPFGASVFIVNNMKDRGGRPGVEVKGGGR
ncbi:hypothetical protein FIV42_29660 [Persicimonas caeni]|uniref:TonB family protein n=1 Tax=Persicimonas caeni TaxID=2292766 RepID=A0A4Y6Q2I2_PERCE|nr:hypothetical protein [Persicimonas caeni]QDG54763.1 hypothetical protein FIV42_29660 [Persicimonas caeni]QED35984.1 hypothetical protein FRD00_29655 [Persicimonas caeni]